MPTKHCLLADAVACLGKGPELARSLDVRNLDDSANMEGSVVFCRGCFSVKKHSGGGGEGAEANYVKWPYL